MQSVFKVNLTSVSPTDKPFVPRKAHKKSRGGCLGCKQRRIRCDETKPTCGKCNKTGSECIYPSSADASPKSSSSDDATAMVPLTADMYSMAVDAIEADLAGLVAPKRDPLTPAESVNAFRILQHFQACTALTLGNAQCRAAFYTVVAKKSWDNAFLMHMVLAVSSSHLKRLHAKTPQPKLCQQYAGAEATHWQSGLQLYRRVLDSGTSTGKEAPPRPDFDATLATAILSIIFTFALDDEIPLDAYASGNEDKLIHAINPLASTAGFRGVTSVYDGDLPQTIWMQVVQDSDDRVGTFSNVQDGIDGLPPAFVELCELDSNSTLENNDYHPIIRLLTPLLKIEAKVDNFIKLISFSGRIWRHARPHLHRRDPRCLLLLSYWFALLIQLDQWWLTQRAKSECLAIVYYLSRLEDPQITPLLKFPESLGKAGLSRIWKARTLSIETGIGWENDA